MQRVVQNTLRLTEAEGGDPAVTVVRGRALAEVASLLAGCRRLVCNDRGLMHVAEAVATPVLAFFGPTVAAFGYTTVARVANIAAPSGLQSSSDDGDEVAADEVPTTGDDED